MMKKLLFCLVTLLGTGTFYSCQQDEVVNEVLANKSVTIRASLPGDASSRVILGETTDATTDIYWEEGDEISLTIGSNTYTFTIQNFVANQTTATFTCADANLPATLEAGTYTFVYGSDAVAKEQAGTKEGLSDYHYMAATLEITEATPWSEVNLTFETQVAIVEIPVPADASASKVSLYNIADGTKIATTATGATIGEYVYFAVPAGNYDGLVLAEKADGNDVYTAYLSSKELVAGNLYRTKELVADVSTKPHEDYNVKFVPLTPGSTTYVFWGTGTTLNETGLGDAIERAIILEDIISVGYKAFENCTNLESFTLAPSVDRLNEQTFSGCTSLTSITLPETVKQLGGYTFKNCENLASINIPAGVTNIGNGLFEGCKSLTSITLPAGVTAIGDKAFLDCEKLTTVTFASGSGVTAIGDYAFKNCENLTTVTLPSTITTLGIQAFFGCKALTGIVIPAGVTSIEQGAFSGCENLASINIPDGLDTIEESTFYGCKALTSITLPESVTVIEQQAFYDCEKLASINIPEGVTIICPLVFYNCKALTSITLPAGVTEIGNYAFMGCKSLESIILPKDVTAIGNLAFNNCSNLKTVTCKATTPPTLGTSMFYNSSMGMSTTIYVENIYVPSGSVDPYKAATNWSTYSDKIKAIP